MVKELEAKFIGRAIYRWGGEDQLGTAEFWSNAGKCSFMLIQISFFKPVYLRS